MDATLFLKYTDAGEAPEDRLARLLVGLLREGRPARALVHSTEDLSDLPVAAPTPPPGGPTLLGFNQEQFVIVSGWTTREAAAAAAKAHAESMHGYENAVARRDHLQRRIREMFDVIARWNPSSDSFELRLRLEALRGRAMQILDEIQQWAASQTPPTEPQCLDGRAFQALRIEQLRGRAAELAPQAAEDQRVTNVEFILLTALRDSLPRSTETG